ncbi:MAG: hypothetical protein ACYTAF_01270 [Planctomycetota bacterium]|jgi:type II secretory pathway component HofQ
MRSFLICSAVVLAVAVSGCAHPKGRQCRGKPVTLSFDETKISEAILKVATDGGLDVVIAPTVKGKVSVDLKDVPAAEALKKIASGLGYAAFRTRGGIFCVVPEEEAPEKKAGCACGDGCGKDACADRLEVTFEDADVRQVLKIIADASGVKLETAPEVKGRVTLLLEGVCWCDAIDAVALTLGYASKSCCRSKTASVALPK